MLGEVLWTGGIRCTIGLALKQGSQRSLAEKMKEEKFDYLKKLTKPGGL